MEAIFSFKVVINDTECTTTMGMEKMEGLDCEKVATLSKFFATINNKVKNIMGMTTPAPGKTTSQKKEQDEQEQDAPHEATETPETGGTEQEAAGDAEDNSASQEE